MSRLVLVLSLAACGPPPIRVVSYPLSFEDSAVAAQVVEAFTTPDSGIGRTLAVERTNSLYVEATEDGHLRVREILALVDVDICAMDEPELRVFWLQERAAADLLPVLRGVLDDTSLRLEADPYQDSIVARGAPDEIRLLGSVIDRLDTSGEGDPASEQ